MSSNPNYDSELCGKVPIHLINTVQPYGILLVIARASLEVIQASENVAPIFGMPAQDLVGTAMEDHLDPTAIALLRQIAAADNTDRIPQMWSMKGEKHLSLLHVKEKYILAEVENQPFREAEQRSFVSIYQEIKFSMALIESATTTTAICSVAARELKRISGFDKVMIYRFDRDWNGTVIAEEREEDMESYAGFTFPASDIPKQARALYLRNPYRFIPDRNYQPVKIYPVINPVTQSFTDLSDCNVRGAVSVHLEYLANMGVTASMSTRILNNDRLWGLIACHHKTARPLTFQLCSVFELVSDFISARINSLYNKEKQEAHIRVRDIYARLLEQVYDSRDVYQGLLKRDASLLNLFDAQGAVIAHGGRLDCEGLLPDRESLDELLLWLRTRRLTRTLHTDHLSGQFDRAAHYPDFASGLLAIPYHPEEEKYLLLFRPQVKKVIDWGGDPGERIVYEKDGLNYHPRNSFRQWREIVSGTSLPWKEEQLTVAENLKSFLYEYTSKQI
ncbi:MAG TPA: GAF domain-containing protein [Puia sp.]|nr:GAF domain-containing protein [Puia sp.]